MRFPHFILVPVLAALVSAEERPLVIGDPHPFQDGQAPASTLDGGVSRLLCEGPLSDPRTGHRFPRLDTPALPDLSFLDPSPDTILGPRPAARVLLGVTSNPEPRADGRMDVHVTAVLHLARGRAKRSLPDDPDCRSILLLLPLTSLPLWDGRGCVWLYDPDYFGVDPQLRGRLDLAGNPPPWDDGWGSRANEDVFGGHEEYRFPEFPSEQVDGSYGNALDAAERDTRHRLDPAQIS